MGREVGALLYVGGQLTSHRSNQLGITIMKVLSKTEVSDRVKKVIANSLCLDNETLKDHHLLWEDLLADHLDLFLLVSHLEEEFSEYHFVMPDIIIKQSATVAGIVLEVDNILNTKEDRI